MRSAFARLGKLGSTAFRRLAAMDDQLTGAAHAGAHAFNRVASVAGLPPRLRLIPLACLAGPESVVVRAQVLADPFCPGSRPQSMRSAVVRQLSPPAADVEVAAEWEGRRGEGRSDARGLVSVSFSVETPPAPISWATLKTTLSGNTSEIRAPVFSLPEAARYLVVSDIDDTIIETELEKPVRRIAQLGGVSERLPFPGIVDLLKAFHREHSLICYLSNSSWRLQEPLFAFFTKHGLPPGPLLLRHRAAGDASAPSAVTHKQDTLRDLGKRFGELPFILLGDSSREDPLRYLEFAEAYPDRVLAIYIRELSGSLVHFIDLDAARARAEALGVPMVVTSDTRDIAVHAEKLGFIRKQGAGDQTAPA